MFISFSFLGGNKLFITYFFAEYSFFHFFGGDYAFCYGLWCWELWSLSLL